MNTSLRRNCRGREGFSNLGTFLFDFYTSCLESAGDVIAVDYCRPGKKIAATYDASTRCPTCITSSVNEVHFIFQSWFVLRQLSHHSLF